MKVALFTSAEGHLSISEAIQEFLETKHEVVTFYNRNESFAIYTPIYQYFPIMNKVPFTLSQNLQARKAIQDVFKLRFETELETFFQEHQPDICISSYFMYNPTLEEFQERYGVPFINVVTDPWSIHPIIVSDTAATNLLFDETSLQNSQKFHPDAQYHTTGWFVRPQFAPAKNVTAIRKKLNLDENLFTILITAGSEGSMMVAKLIPTLLRLTKPTQIVVVAGNNKNLYSGMNTLRDILNRVNKNSTLITLEFVQNLHEYMQAADLVVGKAGPNSLFESVATHTPFFAVTHVSGQEDGNLDIIRDYSLGLVEENPIKAMWKLKEIIEDPSQLDQFKAPIKKMAAYNAKSGQKLLQVLKRIARQK